MKTSITNASKEFSPFDLKITVETQEDAARLYAFFNHTDIAIAWDYIVRAGLSDELVADKSNMIRAGIINAAQDGIYQEARPYHAKICELLK